MENRIIGRGSVEMSVVCSDLSLLDSINELLRERGVISVEDESGILHYIVDGRNNRNGIAGKVTSIDPNESAEQQKEWAYLETCVRSVLREYGFDMSLIGTVIIYNSIFLSYKKFTPLPLTMKGLYCEMGRELGLSYEQSERDVRYAINRSSLKNMRSRAAIRCIQSRIERRLGFRDPLE